MGAAAVHRVRGESGCRGVEPPPPQATRSLSPRASLTPSPIVRTCCCRSELKGKTIGIIGLGRIGRELSAFCRALGMTPLGFDPVLARSVAHAEGIDSVSLDELFSRSDFISLHTPLTPETKGLINADTLRRCKDGVRIVNCARGGIVDELSLLGKA